VRQTLAFQATGFDVSPVEIEMEEDGLPPEEGELPTALLAFESGGNVVLTLPLDPEHAENMMNAFTQAEAHREALPDAASWEPQPSGLPEGLFWVLQPNVVGVSVTPPQSTPDGPVLHWTLAFEDEDGSQVQVALGDALCVRVIRALAQVANDELTSPDSG
jgi:hypothetical protein